MIMKTTKEMIEVMQAYDRGEQVQLLNIDGNWEYKDNPSWNWTKFDYRVKPKKSYVPFDTAEEFLAAQMVHGIHVYFGGCKYGTNINANGGIILSPSTYTLNVVITDLENIFVECKFLDGTPCGKEVETCQQ